ncbi:MAG: aminotransferase class I/II-fold pyridoxal phosphate-dependent enzyme [Flavobacteriales bacterium]|nr:aminotransferase class I/II-fold pyridoxal phosphate-dependent enzyme [Flavobacteriales bacterium]MBK6944601.1 aminotransferase class I/II-fold pyridoxal phosphate-dependent enzyme [Flavobacteriales bacterium]MBK7241249.1 aminotransferase class I/II-fold pyridoxal phosphate-dependent enzyme [Flavobacteriales bacterium]MBK9534256.1 aminotransferase class I/II-fold pyridoxal phosphate-dependent enzyme [Flavobacteriales bacterium]MBP9139574.1 aminotransferase class I/II-fold pyridoxal phosphate
MAITVPDKLPRVGTTIFTVMSQLAQKTGAINLSQGFPDFPIDPSLTELVVSAMKAGHNQYAPMAGLPALREAIVNKVAHLYGTGYDPDTEVTITAGATQAIFTAIGAVVSVGDEVIIIDPAYDCYAPAVALFGGVPVHVALSKEMVFSITDVAKAITPRTRLLIINTPHNPAGAILREADMRMIAELLKGTNILLLSDEVYEHIVFDPADHASAMRYPELRERAFVVFSFGKVFHATGWKGGYVLAPAALMNGFRKVHQFNVFSVNTPIQHALAAYMQNSSVYENVSEMYQKKRDRFVDGLKGSRWRLLPCEGSYFQVADYSAISDSLDLDFAVTLAEEHRVAAIPLSPFYATKPEGQRLIRFCFAKEDSTLDKAIERLCRI